MLGVIWTCRIGIRGLAREIEVDFRFLDDVAERGMDLGM